MSDYVARIKIQNGRIYQLMVERGMNQSDLARSAGVSPSDLGTLVNFKKPPIAKDGRWRACVLRIADVFGCLPDELFSPEQLTHAVPSNKRDYLMTHEEVMQLADEREEPSLEQGLNEEQFGEFIEYTLKTLPPRERRVIAKRFGFDGFDEMTLDEIAEQEGCTRERIRQIEAKALRKLRDPSRSDALRIAWTGE